MLRAKRSLALTPTTVALSLLLRLVQRVADGVVSVDIGIGVADPAVAIAGDGDESCSSLWSKFGSRFTSPAGSAGSCGGAYQAGVRSRDWVKVKRASAAPLERFLSSSLRSRRRGYSTAPTSAISALRHWWCALEPPENGLQTIQRQSFA